MKHFLTLLMASIIASCQMENPDAQNLRSINSLTTISGELVSSAALNLIEEINFQKMQVSFPTCSGETREYTDKTFTEKFKAGECSPVSQGAELFIIDWVEITAESQARKIEQGNTTTVGSKVYALNGNVLSELSSSDQQRASSATSEFGRKTISGGIILQQTSIENKVCAETVETGEDSTGAWAALNPLKPLANLNILKSANASTDTSTGKIRLYISEATLLAASQSVTATMTVSDKNSSASCSLSFKVNIVE